MPDTNPITRQEKILAAISGETDAMDNLNEPITRQDKLLYKILESGGGGGGNGTPGEDGFSPVANVTKTDGVATITITDKSGTTTTQVSDGAAGPQGDTGPAAGFATPAAYIDANTGTPSVSVTASGPDTAKQFTFLFSNLKGAQGEPGADAKINGVNTLTLTEGENVTVEQSGSTLTISAKDTTYNPATKTENGLMEAGDKLLLEKHSKELGDIWEIVQQSDTAVYKTVTGNPVIVSDGYDNGVVRSLSITFPDDGTTVESVTIKRYAVQRTEEDSIQTVTATVDASTGELTPSEDITTLLGENVIYAESGDTSLPLTLSYRVDLVYMQYNAYTTTSTSGDPVEFNDGAENIPVKDLSVEIAPAQSGTGEPYPPGGGKNLINNIWDRVSLNANGVTGVKNGDTFVLSGTNTGTSTINWYVKLYDTNSAFTLSPGTYTLSGVHRNGGKSAGLYVYYRANNTNNRITATTGTASTFTITEETANCFLVITISAGMTVDGVTITPMLETGSTASAFAPYSNIRPISGFNSIEITRTDADGGNTRSVTVSTGEAGTVYGGTLNLTTGLLTVTHGLFNLGELTFYSPPQYPNLLINSTNIKDASFPVQRQNGIECLCDTYKVINSNVNLIVFNSDESYENTIIVGSSALSSTRVLIAIHDSGAYNMDEEIIHERLSSVNILYPYTTPVTYQLTPAELTTLAGYNRISCNAGIISALTYRADPALAYQSLETTLTNAILSFGANI